MEFSIDLALGGALVLMIGAIVFGAVEGLALVPALIGGLVVGILAEVATRFMTGGAYTGRPVSV